MKLRRQRRHAAVLQVLAAFAGLGLLAVGLVVFLVYRTITVGGDLRSMRGAVMDGLDVRCANKVEFSVRPWLAGLVRLGVGFAPVEPEVRSVVGAFRGAEVGVYELTAYPDPTKRGELVRSVTKLMAARDWEPTVTVLNGDELVMIFMPDEELSPRDVTAVVFVLHERQLVLVSGAGNLESIAELARGKLGESNLPPLFAGWRHD